MNRKIKPYDPKVKAKIQDFIRSNINMTNDQLADGLNAQGLKNSDGGKMTPATVQSMVTSMGGKKVLQGKKKPKRPPPSRSQAAPYDKLWSEDVESVMEILTSPHLKLKTKKRMAILLIEEMKA